VGKRDNARKRRATLEALVRQKGRCFYCKEPLGVEVATADHRKPKRFGGTDCRENIAASCEDCNRIKSDLEESYFFRQITAKEPPRRRALIPVWLARKIYKECKRSFGASNGGIK
jgi:5-methylcytosine-specific restriction endonuclease McrA